VTANFRTAGPFVPFARAEAGVLSYHGDFLDGSKASIEAPILAAGMRWMVGSSAAVSFELDYDHVTHPGGFSDTPRNDIEFAIGVSVLTRYRK
jgi:hypothetical protein